MLEVVYIHMVNSTRPGKIHLFFRKRTHMIQHNVFCLKERKSEIKMICLNISEDTNPLHKKEQNDINLI